MTWQDLANAIKEVIAGLFCWNNVRLLIRDREVKGISILTIAFFSLWGYWNLYYYPWLDQILSFIGGIVVVSANTTWVILAVYYTRKKR